MRRRTRDWRWLERSIGLAAARMVVPHVAIFWLLTHPLPWPACRCVTAWTPALPGRQGIGNVIPTDHLAFVVGLAMLVLGGLLLAAFVDSLRPRPGWRAVVRRRRSAHRPSPVAVPDLTPSIEDLGTILGVWAHPDDETYLSAGLMARAIRDGQRVVCVTATRGEEGSWDEERWPTATMGRVREAELLASLALLGVTGHHWLDYHDGACTDVDPTEGTARVLDILRDAGPDTVLTFGPDGMTGHPDHRAVSAWTTTAFEQAAKPGARLYYATTTPEWAARFVPVMNRFDVFGPGTPPVTPREELAIDFELPPELMNVKLQAIEAHVSQVEGMLKAFGQDFFREAHQQEAFRLGDRAERAPRAGGPAGEA